jgi:hypothetical protein
VAGLLFIEAVWALAIYLVAGKLGLRPRPIMIPLVLSPALPLFVAEAWGTAFRVEPGASTAGRPPLIADMLTYLFYATVAIALLAPSLARGYRAPAALFALPQIPLAWFIGLVGVMQVTGVWL